MNILYIADGFGTVYMSQVHNLCNEHSQNHAVTVLSFCKYKDIGTEVNNRKYTLIKVLRPSAFFIPFFAKFTALIFKGKKLFEWADVIHCRGHGSALVSFYIQDKYNLSKPTIVDIRGAIAEEIMYAEHSVINNYIAGQALRAEKIIFNRADYLFFVSEKMHLYYQNQYDYAQNSFTIFPTIVNETYFHKMANIRHQIRTELHLEEKYTYVYSGGTASWQNIDKILVEFNKKARLHNIHLLMLVLNTKTVTTLIKELNIESKCITIMSLEYKDVGKYLNACDAGLVIRDNSIVNYVASPTKVNEYLACGLHIVDKLEEIGNTTYNATYWQNNYMSLEVAITKQQSIYKLLLNPQASKEKV